MGSEEGIQKRLSEAGDTDDPCGNAVYACVKEVKRHCDIVHSAACNYLLCDLLCLVVETDNVVGVPAHRTGYVERELLVEEQERGDLVGNDLGRMIVTVVHKRDKSVLLDISEGELGGTDGISLKTDTENLGLEGDKHLFMVIRHGDDLVEGLLESCARSDPVGGDILVAVGDPDIHDTGLAGLLGNGIDLGYVPDAQLAVRIPEHAEILDAAERPGDAVDRRRVKAVSVRAAETEQIFHVYGCGHIEFDLERLTVIAVVLTARPGCHVDFCVVLHFRLYLLLYCGRSDG